MRFCSANQIAPVEVDEAVVERFIDYRSKTGMRAHDAFRRLLARAWNSNVGKIQRWPARQLMEPPVLEEDPRADAEACRRLSVRSILAAPIRYERDTVGLMEVFSSQSFAFDEGDLAVLERLAQTVLLTLSQTEMLKHS